MATVRFDCSLTCASDAYLWVDGVEVRLDESGVTKTGRFQGQTGTSVKLHAQLEGLKGTAWSLDITPECKGSQPQKLWTRSGTFKKGGVLLDGVGDIPDDPCAPKDGLVLTQKMLPVRKVGDTSSRKTAPKDISSKSSPNT